MQQQLTKFKDKQFQIYETKNYLNQFPLKVAYATTTNKTQGQTIPNL